MTKAYTNCIQHKMQKQQEKNRHGNVEMNIMRIWRQRKSQNTVDWEVTCSLSSAVFGLFEFSWLVCWMSAATFSLLAAFPAQFILVELIWTSELELFAFGMLCSSLVSELCSLLVHSDSSVTCGFVLNLGILQFLSTWLYRLATDLSMSARFWMFFRIPLSSFLPPSACDGESGGGCFRSETGRREDTGGKEVGINWTTGRGWLLAGDREGGRGGGGGRVMCLLTGGGEEDWEVHSGLWREESGGGGGGGGLEGGGVGGEVGRGCCCSGGEGGGFSGGSGMISTVIWHGSSVKYLEMPELNVLRIGAVDFWLARGSGSSPRVMLKLGGTSLPTDIGL